MSIIARTRRAVKPTAAAPDLDEATAALAFEFALDRATRQPGPAEPPALSWPAWTDEDTWSTGPEPTFVLGDDDAFRRVPPVVLDTAADAAVDASLVEMARAVDRLGRNA